MPKGKKNRKEESGAKDFPGQPPPPPHYDGDGVFFGPSSSRTVYVFFLLLVLVQGQTVAYFAATIMIKKTKYLAATILASTKQLSGKNVTYIFIFTYFYLYVYIFYKDLCWNKSS